MSHCICKYQDGQYCQKISSYPLNNPKVCDISKHMFKLQSKIGGSDQKLSQSENKNGLEQWKKYTDIYKYISQLKSPDSKLQHVVSPTSKRGQELILMLQKIDENVRSSEIGNSNFEFNFEWLGPYIYNKEVIDRKIFVKGDTTYTIDLERLELVKLTLECMLFVKEREDENIYLDPGRGDGGYKEIEQLPIINRILAKYKWTKPLCLLGRDCPYWSPESVSTFRQPYSYFIQGNGYGFDNNSILQAAKIIREKRTKEEDIKGRSHFHLWGHLPALPNEGTMQYYDTTKLDPNVEPGWQYDVTLTDKLELKRNCSSQEERERWGSTLNDRWWRANAPYVTELCQKKKGIYYWD
jgi:hypothetical protein